MHQHLPRDLRSVNNFLNKISSVLHECCQKTGNTDVYISLYCMSILFLSCHVFLCSLFQTGRTPWLVYSSSRWRLAFSPSSSLSVVCAPRLSLRRFTTITPQAKSTSFVVSTPGNLGIAVFPNQARIRDWKFGPRGHLGPFGGPTPGRVREIVILGVFIDDQTTPTLQCMCTMEFWFA